MDLDLVSPDKTDKSADVTVNLLFPLFDHAVLFLDLLGLAC